MNRDKRKRWSLLEERGRLCEAMALELALLSEGAEAEKHINATAHLPRRMSNPPYWVIVRHGTGLAEIFTANFPGSEPVLAVFGFREEAQLFMEEELGEGGWQVRSTGAGELISVLYGPCRRAGRVALDPLPTMLVEGMVDLVSLSRERFIDSLLDRGHSGFEARYHSGVT